MTLDRLPEILVVEDVAEALRLSPTQVRRLLAMGRLPGTRRGRRWYCRREDLLARLAPVIESPSTHAACASCGACTPVAQVGGSPHAREALCACCAVALDLRSGPGGCVEGLMEPPAPEQV